MIKMIMTLTIRYELPDNTNLAIVTFNNESRVEHQLASLTRFVSLNLEIFANVKFDFAFLTFN